MKEVIELLSVYPTWVKIAVLVLAALMALLFAGIVVLLLFFRAPDVAARPTANSFSEEDRKRLARKIHTQAGKPGGEAAKLLV